MNQKWILMLKRRIIENFLFVNADFQRSCLKLLKWEEVGFDLQSDMKSTIIVIIWSHDQKSDLVLSA